MHCAQIHGANLRSALTNAWRRDRLDLTVPSNLGTPARAEEASGECGEQPVGIVQDQIWQSFGRKTLVSLSACLLLFWFSQQLGSQ